MLMYFNRGIRYFGKNPSQATVTLRYNWEFYAVLSGKAAPYFSASEKLPLVGDSLWLLPPRRKYAWWSRTGNADRIVFHFSSVNECLEQLVAGRDYYRIALDREKKEKLRRIAEEVEPHYCSLTLLSPLHFDRAQSELSLLVAESMPANEIKTLDTKSQVVARRALAYYESRLPRRPLLDEVAQSVGVSTTHIRRLFHEVFQSAPKRLFLQAQFEKAKRLASGSDMLIDEIARLSGFVDASHLCALFRKYHHITFSKWRTQLVSLKRMPHLRSSAFAPGMAPDTYS